MIAYMDLFSGIGGCAIAAELAGFTPVAFCEIEDFPRRVLKHHWPGVPILDDVRTITAESFRGRVDVLHASPPCQSLSIAGKQEAEADLRYLWPDTIRVVSLFRPTWVCIENVDNAVNLVLDDWLSDLDDIGYESAAVVLPAAAVGAPHIRNRLFVVAHANESGRSSGGLRSNGSSERTRREHRTDPPGRSGSAVVAHATGDARKLQPGEWEGIRDESSVDGNAGSFVADAALLGYERTRRARDGRNGSEDSDPFLGTGEQIKSRLGGNADVVSSRLDGYTFRGLTWNGWPAGMGPRQYDDEPPRTGGSRVNRRARLKAIGNAVPPAQIYPIFRAIRTAMDAA